MFIIYVEIFWIGVIILTLSRLARAVNCNSTITKQVPLLQVFVLLFYSENTNPNPTEVLHGYKPECNNFHTFNHYLLIARYYVYLARNKFETPELEVFIVLLEIKIQCEREIAITKGNLNKYRKKWTTLCISD